MTKFVQRSVQDHLLPQMSNALHHAVILSRVIPAVQRRPRVSLPRLGTVTLTAVSAELARTAPLPDLLEVLGVDTEGLTASEAALRLTSVGANEVVSGQRHSAARLLLRQFASPLTLILLGATAVSMAAGDVIDGLIILAVIVPTGILGFWQEHSAGKFMQTLAHRLQPTADVLRDGAVVTIPAREVVPGDVVTLSVGAIVSADSRVLASEGLELDESTLTGESLAVAKTAGRDVVSMGTHVTAGTGTAVVFATGAQTAYGAIAADMAAPMTSTSFERGSTQFGLLIVRYTAVLLAAVLAVNIALHRPLVESLLFSLALAVGLTPQLLPVIVSVTLASGARHLAKASVLVKRLDAIEDFGSMTILCCDKTGTLTVGAVSLDRAVDPAGAPSDAVLRWAAINSRFQTGYANAIDDAVAAAAPADLGATVLDEVAYDFERRRLSVLVELVSSPGTRTLVTKGAVHAVVDVSAFVRMPEGVVPMAEAREGVQTMWEALSSEGLRVLAVATRPIDRATVTAANEVDLVLEGFVAFADPVKPDALQALSGLRALGIEPVLLTGDNPLVATSVASQTGFPTDVTLTGSQVAAMDEPTLVAAAQSCRVFAEVEPLQKERIVRALQGAGHSVGLLGDGVNDSAALRVADVGISVDTAAQVAKETAAIVLLKKDLGTIEQGVRLGRRTFTNTLKYIHITISANFGNVLSMAVACAFLPFLPLLPVQVLLLNFLSDIPALTIASDSVDDEDIARARTWDLPATQRFMVVFGLVSTVFDLTAFVILRAVMQADAATFHSAWFVESNLTELAALMVLRTVRPFWRSRPSVALGVACWLVVAVTIAFPFLPVAAAVGLVPLSADVLAVMVTISLGYVAANELAKRAVRGASR